MKGLEVAGVVESTGWSESSSPVAVSVYFPLAFTVGAFSPGEVATPLVISSVVTPPSSA